MFDLRAEVENFASEIAWTISGALAEDVTLESETVQGSDRFWIRPAVGANRNRIPLRVDGEHLADLGLDIYLEVDREGAFLKTIKSKTEVHSYLDRTPLIRLEYDSRSHTAPFAHWHIHAERGAFSHLLSRAHLVRPSQVAAPHKLSSLHIPVGGERFRPCFEDVLQFLIQECGVDPGPEWVEILAVGRENWRRRQTRTVVRDAPEEAARTLSSLGWAVTPPPQGPGLENIKTLQSW